MKKIAVVGSINMDLTVQADRLPGKGETVPGRDLRYLPGGKGANQAVAAARLGGAVTMFGCVGDDVLAEQLVQNLAANGVDTRFIQHVPRTASGIALITVAENDNTIVTAAGANACVTPDCIAAWATSILQADILLLQNEIPPASVRAVIRLAADARKTILYNPAPAAALPQDLLEKVTYLTPNEHEAACLFPEQADLNRLLADQNGRLIVTLGANGAAGYLAGRVLRVPARPAQVVDTTGAGDTFNGALAFALANELPLDHALLFANTAASLSTEQAGAQAGMPALAAVCAELPSRIRADFLP